MRYYLYKDVIGQWRWRLVSANGRTIADSGESYWNRADCINGITLVKGSSAAPIHEA